MSFKNRPVSFWTIILFLAVSVALMLVGQTMAVFDYEFTVSYGLQEDPAEVGETVKQVNRGFGAGDTVVYIPLMVLSFVGLWLRKKWSLIITAAFAGVSLYWTVTVSFIFLFLPGTEGYSHTPEAEIWLFIFIYFVFGLWSLLFLVNKGERLLA